MNLLKEFYDTKLTFAVFFNPVEVFQEWVANGCVGLRTSGISLGPIHNSFEELGFCKNYNPQSDARYTLDRREQKLLIYSPENLNNISIGVSSLRDGWHSKLYQLNKILDVGVIEWEYGNEAPDNARIAMTYFLPKGESRVVYAARDNKWIFCEQGPVQSFENPDYYNARLVKHRLNRKILLEYCEKLGLPVLSDDFWKISSRQIVFKYSW